MHIVHASVLHGGNSNFQNNVVEPLSLEGKRNPQETRTFCNFVTRSKIHYHKTTLTASSRPASLENEKFEGRIATALLLYLIQLALSLSCGGRGLFEGRN